MALTVNEFLSEKYRIPAGTIKKLGAFDSFMDTDALLFVDPFLVKKSTAPELKGAYEVFLDNFRNVLKLLMVSDKEGDRFWEAASEKLMYKEIPEFGLGYTGKGTAGSAIGDGLRNQILKSMDTLIKKGIDDPILFELVGVFEPNIGCDRISDMTCVILYSYFMRYTQRVLVEAGVKPDMKFSIGDDEFFGVEHPFKKGRPIALVPADVLRDLPVADDFDSLSSLSAKNANVRSQLNGELGKDWHKTVKDYKKEDYKKYVLNVPTIAQALIEEYKRSQAQPYDLEKDYKGLVTWDKLAKIHMAEMPMEGSITRVSVKEDLFKLVDDLVLHYKKLIEQNGLWQNLYRDKECEDPHHESYAQNLFLGCAQYYCRAHNLDLSPEVDGGRGPVDFKISRGAEFKALVEIKKSDNSHLTHALEKQVPIYEAGLDTHIGYLAVVEVVDDSPSLQRMMNRAKELATEGKKTANVVVINGRPQKSASKA